MGVMKAESMIPLLCKMQMRRIEPAVLVFNGIIYDFDEIYNPEPDLCREGGRLFTKGSCDFS